MARKDAGSAVSFAGRFFRSPEVMKDVFRQRQSILRFSGDSGKLRHINTTIIVNIGKSAIDDINGHFQ